MICKPSEQKVAQGRVFIKTSGEHPFLQKEPRLETRAQQRGARFRNRIENQSNLLRPEHEKIGGNRLVGGLLSGTLSTRTGSNLLTSFCDKHRFGLSSEIGKHFLIRPCVYL